MSLLTQEEQLFLDKIYLYSTDRMNRTIKLTPLDRTVLSRLIRWGMVEKDGDKIRIKN